MFSKLAKTPKKCAVQGCGWVGNRVENLFRDAEMAKIGIGVDEFGSEGCVLMEAMEDEAGMDLLEMSWDFAEG